MPEAQRTTVHLLVGLNGAGKSTYARRLQRERPVVRFTLDEWMIRLYRLRYDDPSYPALADTCQDLVWDTAQQVLATGTEVVLDWNQWSRQRRATWRDKVLGAGHQPVLHHLRVSVETAIARAEERGRRGAPGSHVLDAQAIRHLDDIFEPPMAEEGLEIHIVQP